MSLAVARQEMVLLWRAGVMPALAVVLALLMGAAAIAGVARQKERAEQTARFRSIVLDQWRDQPDRHPHRVAHYGFLVFREPPPLGFLDPGVSAFTGTSLFLEAHRQNMANFAEASVSSSAGRFGDLTPANVLQLFLPLAILMLAATSITREREAGTLALALSQGVTRRQIAMGKWLGVLLGAALASLPGLAFALVVVAGNAGLGGEPLRLLLFAALIALLCFIVAAIGASISARAHSSRDALLIALALWVSQWVALPRALPAVANQLWPLPSRSAFEAEVEREMRSLGDSHNPNDPKFLAFRAGLLRQHGVNDVADLPQNFGGLVMAEGERHTAAAYATHMARLEANLKRHEALTSLGGVLSPFLSARALSMQITGGDARHAREFDRQAEAYRFALIQELNRLHAEKVEHAKDRYQGGAEGAAPSRQRIDRSHFLSLPSFTYRAPDLAWSLGPGGPSLTLLVFWALLALALLLRQTRTRTDRAEGL